MKKGNSPYTAAFTGGSFMMHEMNSMLPLFLADNSQELLAKETEENNVLKVSAVASRKKYISELSRRFHAAPPSFWADYQAMDEPAQRLAIFFVLLTTYRIVLDFHLNVALKKWNSIDHRVHHDDVAMELSQIAANDAFVDSWSDTTKKRVVTAYLTFINQAGLYDKKSFELHKPANVSDSDYAYYVLTGREWFLEACLLQPYEIERIKRIALKRTAL